MTSDDALAGDLTRDFTPSSRVLVAAGNDEVVRVTQNGNADAMVGAFTTEARRKGYVVGATLKPTMRRESFPDVSIV